MKNGASRRDELGRPLRVDDLFDRAPCFLALATACQNLDPLESLLGPNIVLFANRHNHGTYVWPGSAPARLHRDVLQWSRGVVTAIVFLDHTEAPDGCTEIVPGSQFLPFVGTPNNGGAWMDEHSLYADLRECAVAVPMPAGSILLFDSLAFHRSGRNQGPTNRAAATFAYTAIDELAPSPPPGRRLVRGEWIYRGNDA